MTTKTYNHKHIPATMHTHMATVNLCPEATGGHWKTIGRPKGDHKETAAKLQGDHKEDQRETTKRPQGRPGEILIR